MTRVEKFMVFATGVLLLGLVAPAPEVVLSYMPVPDLKADAFSELFRLFAAFFLIFGAGFALVVLKIAAFISPFILTIWAAWRLLCPKSDIEVIL